METKTQITILEASSRILKNDYETIYSKDMELHRLLHDYRNQLLMLTQLDPSEMNEHIKNYLDCLSPPTSIAKTGDPFLNAILNVKLSYAKTKNIDFFYTVQLPKPLNIPSVDLCCILSNLFDNAIEACMRIPEPDKRWIHFNLDQKGYFIFMQIENSTLKINDLQTAKDTTTEPHGLGLKNVIHTIKKHNGTFSYKSTASSFLATIVLESAHDEAK